MEINTDEVYKKLKKQNGEAVAKVMREAVLLDVPNIVHVLEFAGRDADEVRQLVPVIREIYKTQNQPEYRTNKNPLELLSDAGYDAFVVDSLEKQNSIKKYFRSGEELCTFRDSERFENYYMIHAVKRGADKIKPSEHPERQDEYGTSVISIQIAKTGGFISIKNRYNHTVDNPDNTFDSNPDKIIPGLANSLKRHFHVDFNTAQAPLPDDFRMVNDQLVRYNYEINNMYFGSDYYFSGSEITKLNKDYEVMLDCFILNKKTGQVYDPCHSGDSCVTILNDLFMGKKIEVKKNKSEQQLFADGTHVATVKDGEIIYIGLPNNITEIEGGFLRYNKKLTSIDLPPDITKIGYYFLQRNKNLISIDLPNVTEIGDGFLGENENLTSINLPNVTEIGYDFLRRNKNLTSIDLPNVTEIGGGFLGENENLTSINLPNVTEIGDGFLISNESLTFIDLPNVTKIGDGFLGENKNLTSINLPNVTEIGDGFLGENENLTSINLPNVTKIGNAFLCGNKNLTSINLPNVTEIGDGFLISNESLTSIDLLNVTKIGDGFLGENKNLTSINLPNVTEIGDDFLGRNKSLTSIDLPNVTKIGNAFLCGNKKLTSINLPNVTEIGGGFLQDNKKLKSINAPKMHPNSHNIKRLRMICAINNVNVLIRPFYKIMGREKAKMQRLVQNISHNTKDE